MGVLAPLPQRTARRSLSPALAQQNLRGTREAAGKHERSPENSPQKEKGHKRPVGLHQGTAHEAQAASSGGEVSSPTPVPGQQNLTGTGDAVDKHDYTAHEAQAAPAGGDVPSPTPASGQHDLASVRESAGKHDRTPGNSPPSAKGRKMRGGLRQFQGSGRQQYAAPTCEEVPSSTDASRVSETSSAESGLEGADFQTDH